MKKLLSSVLILTLSLNPFGANCSAISEIQTEASETTVSEKLNQINNILAQIESTTSSETKEASTEENKDNQKDNLEDKETQKTESISLKKYFGKRFFILKDKENENTSTEKAKVDKETQKTESISLKKYFGKIFFINAIKILEIIATLGCIYAIAMFKHEYFYGSYENSKKSSEELETAKIIKNALIDSENTVNSIHEPILDTYKKNKNDIIPSLRPKKIFIRTLENIFVYLLSFLLKYPVKLMFQAILQGKGGIELREEDDKVVVDEEDEDDKVVVDEEDEDYKVVVDEEDDGAIELIEEDDGAIELVK